MAYFSLVPLNLCFTFDQYTVYPRISKKVREPLQSIPVYHLLQSWPCPFNLPIFYEWAAIQGARGCTIHVLNEIVCPKAVTIVTHKLVSIGGHQ